MKFSIIIPTQDRPELVSLSAYYVLSQNYKNIELIVSDNSTTAGYKEKNRQKLEEHIKSNKLLLVSPPKELSVPEHFEFALQYATGDYVFFLTDKMMLLPNTLTIAADAISKSSAEIVNWDYYPFITDNYLEPFNSGNLYYVMNPLNTGYVEYDPLEALRYKANGITPRSDFRTEDYVKGKICFGGFSKNLISRIIGKSGALFGGATHDYSALVQALCLAPKCILLNERGVLFISLPLDKSLGSLTHIQAAAALKYYQAFTDSRPILNSLLVPGLYSSSHNMVAHDYIKYLHIYGKEDLFFAKFWISCIGNDLCFPGKKWSSQKERKSQYKLFLKYIRNNRDTEAYSYIWKLNFICKSDGFLKLRKFLRSILKKVVPLSLRRRINLKEKQVQSRYKMIQVPSLEAAFKFINAGYVD